MDLDEVARYEPNHQDLRCLQIQLPVFLSPVLKELSRLCCNCYCPADEISLIGFSLFRALSLFSAEWLNEIETFCRKTVNIAADVFVSPATCRSVT